MSSNIRIKRTATPGEVPSGLALGELAMNTADGMLYMKSEDGVIAGVSLTNSWGTSGNNIYYTTGNVGIGTSSPDARLNVVESSTGRAWSAIGGVGDLIVERNGNAGLAIVAANTSASSINFGDTDDANAGFIIYYHNEDALAFRTSGSGEDMRIDSSGRVGIGTSSPSQKLEVAGAIVATGAASTYSSDGLYIQNKGGSIFDIGAWRSGASVGIISFSTDSGSDAAPLERMRIDQNGNVGIGTAAPAQKLSVVGGILEVTSTNTAYLNPNYASQGVALQNASNVPTILTVNNTERMRIDSSGRVGIGTTSPDSRLSILGSLSSTDNSLFVYDSTSFVHNPDFAAQINSYGRSSADVANGSKGGLWVQAGFNQNADIARFSSVGAGYVDVPRLVIKDSGKVGVGTTSPGSYPGKFVVVGDGTVCDREFNSRVASTVANAERGFMQVTDGIEYLHIYSPNGGDNVWEVQGTERMRIDSSGRLLIGTSSSTSSPTGTYLQLSGNSWQKSSILQTRFGSQYGPSLLFANARGSQGSPSILNNGDELGKIRFYGYDGTDFGNIGAEIVAYVDGTPGSNDMPTRLVFSTTADGVGYSTERMRIDSAGNVTIAGNLVYDRGDIATQAEAEAGTNNTQVMTPLRVAQAIAALAGGGSVINSIQRFSGFWSSGSLLNVTISSVDTSKTMLSYLGSWGNYTYQSYVTARVTLTSATNVQLTRLVGSTYNTYYSFEVIEFA